MANVKITALNHQTVFADDDLFLVVDVGEDETRKFTYANLIGTAGNVHVVSANTTAVEARRVANVTLMNNEDTALQARITANAATVTAIEARRVANVTIMTNEDTALQARITANATLRTNEDTALQARITANAATVTAIEARRVANVTEQTAIEARRVANIAGAVSTITTSDLTASRALVSSGSGKIAISDITSTELGHLDGVSSGIQTQLDAKAAESTRSTNAAALAAGIASSSPDITIANILHTTSTANSYATGGTTSDIDKVLVYLSGIYQTENQYVLGNSTHNVQFKEATLAAGLELEIRKF